MTSWRLKKNNFMNHQDSADDHLEASRYLMRLDRHMHGNSAALTNLKLTKDEPSHKETISSPERTLRLASIVEGSKLWISKVHRASTKIRQTQCATIRGLTHGLARQDSNSLILT